jgi:two-component system sensor histidine kinase PilS (NtrC family)
MTESDAARDRRAGDRRRGDRRQTERRHSRLPAGAASMLHDEEIDPAVEERASGLGELMTGEPTIRRIVRVYVGARVVVGLCLMAVHAGGVWLGLPTPAVLLVASTLYTLQAFVLWLLPPLRAFMGPPAGDRHTQAQWLATIGVDLAAFFTLQVAQPDSSLNYVALLVLPVLMSGVLTTRVLALGTAAAVALMLLAVGWRTSMNATDGVIVLAQQGVAGIGFFLIAVVTSELAARLSTEEQTARGRLAVARTQARLNRLVLEEMTEGVLVVDDLLRVRAANPAARQLLAPAGAPAAPFPLTAQPAWAPLAELVREAFETGGGSQAGRTIELQFDSGQRRVLLVRLRFTRSRVEAGGKTAGQEAFCVLFLEDMREVQARQRTDKLAAMGRMSAGIAHEIRNPLAAIAQANQLLAEDAGSPHQQRLSAMVQENVRRLQRIVGDVLEAAANNPNQDERTLDARERLQEIAREWSATLADPPGGKGVLELDLPAAPVPVIFDPDHLQRVLVNLLDNGMRHGSGQVGTLQLRLAERDARTAVISVASDGAPISPDIERHLFEPFFSTRSRGSGLGLYICRELCERHGASIEFRPRLHDARHRNAFVLVLRRARVRGTSPTAQA